MEVMLFDVPMLATKMTWLMMESITPPWHWMLMKICLVVVVFFFAFLITVLTSNLVIHCSRQNEVELSAATQDDISWLKQLYLKCDVVFVLFFVFRFLCLCFSLVLLLWWVSARSKWSLSSDMTCQSRQEKCSLKVTLLWCLYSVCHYTFHFLCAKIYNLSFDRRSKHL